ncbi:MAG: stalk domain-containing protein [Oscillospiraceae bacterium]
MLKKLLAFTLSVGIALMAFAVYAGATSSEETLFGQVTAISGSTITLALATDDMQKSEGTPPSGAPSGTSNSSTSGTVPSAPPTDSSTSGSSSGTAPSAPPSGSGTEGGLTLTAETKTITVSDSTVITLDDKGQSTSAKLSDITVGSILSVTMSDGTVKAITIRQMQTGGSAQQGVTASPSKAAVTINGSSVSFQAFNIGGNNYFKLRDLAAALNGSGKQFEVGYNSSSNAITLTSGQSYTAVGGELEVSASTSASASVSSSIIYLDGAKVSLTAYNIGGNNYFKLRDVASALNFGVTYDSTTSTIVINTTTGYSA